jgi:uncharacterized membrane protein YbhN (UPF0104 family)
MLRRLILASESAILLVAIMFIGSLVLWVGVPLGWLWIGSHIQGETGSLGFALLSMMAGMLLTTVAVVSFLGRLDRRLIEVQELRGGTSRPGAARRSHRGRSPRAYRASASRRGGATRRQAATALEQVLVLSAVVAVMGFSVWFFGFSGSPPLPGLELSY